MDTLTTAALAREVGVTSKTIRCAIRRGDLLATRIARGSGRTDQAAEYMITREAADDWRARRHLKRTGATIAVNIEAQRDRRRGMYFEANDDQERKRALQRLMDEALRGDALAKRRLSLPLERGGMGLTRWFRAGVGEIILHDGARGAP